MVLDANDAVVGPFVRDGGQDYVGMVVAGARVLIPVTRNGITGDSSLYWSSTNCTGLRYGANLSTIANTGARHDRTILIKTLESGLLQSQAYQSIQYLSGDTPNVEWLCVNSGGTIAGASAVTIQLVDVPAASLPVAPLRVQ